MKRVKKGYERHGEARWFERAGALCIEQLRGVERHTVVLSTSECEALGITAALEDVPTPGERLHNEVWPLYSGQPWDALDAHARAHYESAAARLGIKPERES